MSLPNYDEFRQALTDPARRPQIGLVISDSDARSLAGNEEWARNYFDSWIAMAAPAPTAVMPEAPAAPSPFSSAPSAPSAPSSAPSAEPFGQPGQVAGQPAQPAGQPGGYAPAGYQTAPQQGYASAPQQGGQPFGGQSMPQGQMPKKKGLPGWAIGVIIGGAALVLLGGIGVTALVLNAVGDDDGNSSSSSQPSDDETFAPDDAETTAPDDGDLETNSPDGDFGDFGDLDYSESDAAAYIAIAAPAYGLEASEYMDQDTIDDALLTGGEAVCVSLASGYTSEEELIESLDSAGLEPGAGKTVVDAAKEYLCE